MLFAVTPGARGPERLLHVSGELDIATVELLRSAVAEVLAARPPRLLIDLTDAAFLDSTGCRELMRAGKTGQAAGVPVEVVAPPGNWKVRRVVDFVQLAHLVPVHDALPPSGSP